MIIKNIKELKKPCEDTNLVEADEIIEHLINILNMSKTAVGLAANQVGIKKKIALVKTEELIVLVNPIIIEAHDLMEFYNEGCLSFPGEFITTKRYNEVFVKDLLHPNGIVCVGFEAVAVQHEIGHLYGKTMYDYEIPKLKRNDRCWCESGKKYKMCHSGKIIPT